MAKPQKLRSDAKLAALSVERRAEIDELLMSGWKLEEVLEVLDKADGIKMSLSALSNYYSTHIFPVMVVRTRSAREFAAKAFSPEDRERYGETTTDMLEMVFFDAMAQPGRDIKAIKALGALTLKARDQELTGRRIKLLEEQAALANKTKEILEDDSRSEEEKSKRIKAVFGIC